MKNILFIGTILISMSACDTSGTDASDQRADSLSRVISERDSALINFISSFNEIESNLDSVAAKQKIIFLYSNNKKGELNANKKDRINAEIEAINSLMDKNRKEIAELTKLVSSSKSKNSVLEKTIKTLTIQISQKDYELCELNLQLATMNSAITTLVTTVDSLASDNYIKSIIIDYQTLNLHSTYYIVGTEKELVDKKIIDKKGGLLGIGKTSVLSKDFDNTMFTLMDYTKTLEIPVNGSDIKVITNHPSDSYMQEVDKTKKGEIKNITIINPEQFWGTSKYLVVVKK